MTLPAHRIYIFALLGSAQNGRTHGILEGIQLCTARPAAQPPEDPKGVRVCARAKPPDYPIVDRDPNELADDNEVSQQGKASVVVREEPLGCVPAVGPVDRSHASCIVSAEQGLLESFLYLHPYQSFGPRLL